MPRGNNDGSVAFSLLVAAAAILTLNLPGFIDNIAVVQIYVYNSCIESYRAANGLSILLNIYKDLFMAGQELGVMGKGVP